MCHLTFDFLRGTFVACYVLSPGTTGLAAETPVPGKPNAYFDGSCFHNGKPEAVEGFSTDVWFDYAKRFIKTQKQAGQPFFAYISTNAPHGPMHSPEKSSAPYKDLGVNVQNFFRMIANIDDNVGQLRRFLDEQGLADNNPVTLTCHDWITTGSTPWNHAFVRSAMSGDANTGYWNVSIVEDGVYEIRIRRWPQESDTAIDAALPPGADVPGVKAYRTTHGKAFQAVKATVEIGGQSAEAAVTPGAEEVVFKLKLAAGVTRLSSRFKSADGQEIGGYYAYVKRL